MSNDVTEYKRLAAEAAVEFVESGMVVGLGHGSTAIWALRRIAEKLQSGELREILGVPCSRQVQADAEAAGIPLTTLDAHPVVDITIDGADEADPHFNVIKGGGGALLREKIVAQATRREIIVADYTKTSAALGTLFAVPVEVIPFGWPTQAAYLEKLGAKWSVRKRPDGTEFLTDHHNLILDCAFGPIADVEALAERLNRRAGIVEHGLFIGLVHDLIVAGPDGLRHTRPA